VKNFISVDDVEDPGGLLKLALDLKTSPFAYRSSGTDKCLGLVFFNASLRTRLSTQKAAMNLGMQVMSINIDRESWALETEEGVVMEGNKAEHIKDAAAVVGQYCDIIALRTFPGLVNKKEDYEDKIIRKFMDYSKVPVINLESATRHPLQSLADWMTIEENRKKDRPKVVLSWAPHVKALPQSVPNSFAEWMNQINVDFVITHPQDYELDDQFSGNATIEYDQRKAFEGADFIYAKNWSSFRQYGKICCTDRSWTIDAEKMALTNEAKFMHCMPVRRNLIVTDEVLDSPSSVILQQAKNRVYSAQAVLLSILNEMT
jgi:N-succinyl-L-ornithine transcarbamylase